MLEIYKEKEVDKKTVEKHEKMLWELSNVDLKEFKKKPLVEP